MAGSRVFTAEFRVGVAERMSNGESLTALSAELKIKRSLLYRWRDRYRKEGAAGLAPGIGRPPGTTGGGRPPSAQTATAGRIAELERHVGRLAMENDFLRGAFKRVKEAR